MAPPARKEGFRADDQRPIGGDGDVPEQSASASVGRTGSPGPPCSSSSSRMRRRTADPSGAVEDLILDEAEGGGGVLQCLRALDLQILGACRVDERLKPLLKLNVSTGIAEERLVNHLNQHFEAPEVGMLARCLCIPLVSIRVGKVNKQGNLLCPTSTRLKLGVCDVLLRSLIYEEEKVVSLVALGIPSLPNFLSSAYRNFLYCFNKNRHCRGHLNLYLLPSSNMRISFTGDDGCIERLAVVANDSESSSVTIEDISVDSSGRSFLLKLPGSQISYFWCSEKSKLHGMELLAKMKDLLRKKPSLSRLSGICETRLDSFANHLRAYLDTTSTALSKTVAPSLDTLDSDFHSSSKPSRSRFTASHTTKLQSFYQCSLSPRSNTFKEGMPRGSLSNRNGLKEKHRRRGDGFSSLLTISDLPLASTWHPTHGLSSSQCDGNISTSSVLTIGRNCCSTPCCLPEIPCAACPPSSCEHSVGMGNQSPCSMTSPTFSPYYCWCPPHPSPVQYIVSSSYLPISSTESLSLSPLSSLLSSERPPISIIPLKLPIDVTKLPCLELPTIFPETLLRAPLPVSSRGTLPRSQQIPTFTPFMSDPIVHIPIIDICTAGQGYLVSAEPTLSSTISPLLPTRVNHLISETESTAEKNARETLRMLMATAPLSTSPQLMTMLPDVLTCSGENLSCDHVSNHGTSAGGSRCPFSRTLNVSAVTSGVSLMFLSSSRPSLAHGGNTAAVELSHSEEMALSEGPKVSEGSKSSCDGDSDLLDQQVSE